MAESEADAAYSDEEFGSEYEYEGGYDEFAEEDAAVEGLQNAVKQSHPVEEDAGQYDIEFDEDDPAVGAAAAVVTASQVAETVVPSLEHLSTYLDLQVKVAQVDTEAYNGEFDDDDKPAVREHSPTAAAEAETTSKPASTAANEATNAPPDVNAVGGDIDDGVHVDHAQDNSSDNSEDEYSNDLEQDIPPNSVGLRSDSSEENGAKRRSSVPAARIPVNSPPKSRFVRAGSMPMILLDRPVDKWMDTIPQELSPEKPDRSRKQSEHLPVLEEVQPQNSLDDNELNVEDDESYADIDSIRSTVNARARAKSFKDLQREKTIVPIRRALSLLYAGSLPSVKEVHATDDTAEAANNHDNEDEYSDEYNYDDDSDATDAQPAHVERPKSGPSSAMHEIGASTHTNTADNNPVRNEMETMSAAGELDSNSPMTPATPNEPDPLNEGSTSAPVHSKNEDDYADELDDEFPSDSDDDVHQFEEEDALHDDDYDVDECIEDGRRETENLLQDARTLLELEQNESEPHNQPSKQPIIPPDASTPNGDTTEEDPGDTITIEGSEAEIYATPYDDEDEFGNSDTEAPNHETLEQDGSDEHDRIGQYALDTNDFEDEIGARADPQLSKPVVDAVKASDPAVTPSLEVLEGLQLAGETRCVNNDEVALENETPVVPPSVMLDSTVEEINAQAPTQLPKKLQPAEHPAAVVVEQDHKETSASLKEPLKPNRPEKGQVASRPARAKQPVKSVDPPPEQPSPPMRPVCPPINRATSGLPSVPLSSSTDMKLTTRARSSQSKTKTLQPERQTPTANSAGINKSSSGETTTAISSPRRQESTSKTTQKASSPRSPSKASSAPYQYLPNEYPQLPRKEAVPRQKVSSKPSTSGEHGGKRRLLQPVRTPANLRFDLPKMEKKKRDWLFVNMFRHGDDLSKYEAFVPPSLLARPPATNESRKKRPLSARQVYGGPPVSRFVSSGRKLVAQPNPELQDRERNWVATTPHDSKLPVYDSILDKYCTTVTSPVVQRQIYQTRHRDLSPQLAFVLEKRVEKHCRKGVHDSFGGVSSSYKTEIVPTSPGDGSRQRQTSPRSPNKSVLLERQPASPVPALDE